jgi:hypothetical protein
MPEPAIPDAAIWVLDKLFAAGKKTSTALKALQSVTTASAAIAVKECGDEMRQAERNRLTIEKLGFKTEELLQWLKTNYGKAPNWVTKDALLSTTLNGKHLALYPHNLKACVQHELYRIKVFHRTDVLPIAGVSDRQPTTRVSPVRLQGNNPSNVTRRGRDGQLIPAQWQTSTSWSTVG